MGCQDFFAWHNNKYWFINAIISEYNWGVQKGKYVGHLLKKISRISNIQNQQKKATINSLVSKSC